MATMRAEDLIVALSPDGYRTIDKQFPYAFEYRKKFVPKGKTLLACYVRDDDIPMMVANRDYPGFYVCNIQTPSSRITVSQKQFNEIRDKYIEYAKNTIAQGDSQLYGVRRDSIDADLGPRASATGPDRDRSHHFGGL
jgi:hypothetical protein